MLHLYPMQLTNEQQSVLATNENLVINAVAGSGKTTTLIEYARTRPSNCKILYLAFNKTVKTEAQSKFKAAGIMNVQVETAHSLAFDWVVKPGVYKLTTGYKVYEWRDMLGINTGDLHTDFILAGHVNRFISYFCNSNATRVQDLDYLAVLSDPKAKGFVKNYYKQLEAYTRTALAKMDKAEIAVTHDFYLKKFQLLEPILHYDYILFDEGQDASAAMLHVFLRQPGIKIIVGDVHQQIYGWRFAINSLQSVSFPVYYLSHSFRFNDEVAFVANKVLSWKKQLKHAPAVQVIGRGPGSSPSTLKATLGRSNLTLLLHAIMLWQNGGLQKLYFEGHINSYTFAEEGASLYDVLNLYNGKHAKIRDRLIAGMKTMKELEDYISKTEDNSLAIIVELVKEYGNQLPGLIEELKSHHVSSKEEAEMIFSTVHKCKGMEYDEVTLLNDFITEEKLRKAIQAIGTEKIGQHDLNRLSEEVNILYVALTRAKHKLYIPAEINPLQTVQLAPAVTARSSSHHNGSAARYDRAQIHSRSTQRSSNTGLRWTDDETTRAEELFLSGASLKEIARNLHRTETAVRIKLMNLGLTEDTDNLF